MPKIPHTVRRNGRYEFRIRVPESLRGQLGKSEIRKTLATSDYKLAKSRAAALSSEWLDKFTLAEKEVAKKVALLPTLQQLEAMVRQWFTETNQASAAHHAEIISNLTEAELKEIWYDHTQDQIVYHNPELADERDKWLDADAKQILAAHNATMPLNNPLYQKLRTLVLRANKELLARKADRLKHGKFNDTHHDQFFSVTATALNATPIVSNITMDELATSYLDNAQLDANPTTRASYKKKLELLKLMLGGDTPAASVTRLAMLKVAKTLAAYPSNATKKLPDKTVEQRVKAAAQNSMALLSAKTIKEHLTVYRSFFKYAEDGDLIPKSPMVGIKSPKAEAGKERGAFNDEQIGFIFGNYHAWKWGYGVPPTDVLWVPIIAIYTGMRLAECGQLWASDIEDVDGVLCFRVEAAEHDEHPKYVKSKKANKCRFVPVHSKLIELGLPEKRKLMNGAGNVRLLPDAPAANRYKRLSKWFNRNVKHMCTADVDYKFHSTRHTVATRLLNVGINPLIVSKLGGWANVELGTAKPYYDKQTSVTPQSAIEALHYPTIDHTALKVALWS